MKLLPKSIEIQRALAMDETVKTKLAGDMIEVPNEDDFKPEAAQAPEDEKQIEQRITGKAPHDFFETEAGARG